MRPARAFDLLADHLRHRVVLLPVQSGAFPGGADGEHPADPFGDTEIDQPLPVTARTWTFRPISESVSYLRPLPGVHSCPMGSASPSYTILSPWG